VKARRAEYNSRCSMVGPCTASRWAEAEGAGVAAADGNRGPRLPVPRLQVEERRQELLLQALPVLLRALPLRAGQQ
jgi:hypothetical protein